MKRKFKSISIKFTSILLCLTVLLAIKGFDVFAATTTVTSSKGSFTVAGIPTSWAASASLTVSNYNTSVINTLATQYGGIPSCTALWSTSYNSIFTKWSNGSVYEHTSSGMTVCSDIPSTAIMATHANGDGYGNSPYFYIDYNGNLYGKGGWLGYANYTYMYNGVSYISTSGDHALATTTSGNVIGFGNNTYGQCASYSGGDAIKASAMGQTSYVLTSSTIMSSGSNWDGALGMGLNYDDEITGYDEEGNPIIDSGLQYQPYLAGFDDYSGKPVDLYCGRYVAQYKFNPAIYYTGMVSSSRSYPRSTNSISNLSKAASTNSTSSVYYSANGSLYSLSSPNTALCSVSNFGTYNNSCYALTTSGTLYLYNGTSGTQITTSVSPTYYVSGTGTYNSNGTITLNLMMLCNGSYTAVDTCTVTLSYIDSAAPMISVSASPTQNADSISLVPTATDSQSGLSSFTYVTSANANAQSVSSGQTISVPKGISSITFTATDAVGRTTTSVYTVAASGYSSPSLVVTGNPTSPVGSATLNLATSDPVTVTVAGTTVTHKSTTFVSYEMKVGTNGNYSALPSNSVTITASGDYYFKATDVFGTPTAEVIVPVTNVSSDEIHFIQSSYSINIPSSGNTTVPAVAQVTDRNGTINNNATITYGIAESYSGISIDSNTGIVTVSSDAAANDIQLTATYNSLSCTATLKVIKPSLYLPVTSGSSYKVSMTANNISNFSGKVYTITYDPNVLLVSDLCAFTYEKELTPCTITQTGITITSFTPGQITYTVDKTIPNGRAWSGVLNIFEFVARATCTTAINKQ